MLMGRQWSNRDGGFSFIEVLVAVTIMAIVVVIAVQTFSTAMDNYRLDSSVRRVVDKLQDARINAIKRNNQVWLAINVGAGTFQVQSAGPLDIGSAALLNTGVDFIAPTNTPITFNSLGRPTPAAVRTVTLRSSSSAQPKTVTLSATGRVNIIN